MAESHQNPSNDPQEAPNVLAVSVGNSRTHIGVFEDGELTDTARLANDQQPAIVEEIVSRWHGLSGLPRACIVLASVNEAVAERIRSGVEDQLSMSVYIVGEDLPVPIGRQLDPETITGHDRLLNAAAAYDMVRQACVVVDAGTAVTVDFVDGEGTFHGGAIAPGAQMQLDAMHERTAALPELKFITPDREAFGRSTSQAMLQGVFHGIRGMVRLLTEQYAERYGAYPLVIATGGDAETLFAEDELIDRVVSDLTLKGIAVTVRYALNVDSESSS